MTFSFVVFHHSEPVVHNIWHIVTKQDKAILLLFKGKSFGSNFDAIFGSSLGSGFGTGQFSVPAQSFVL